METSNIIRLTIYALIGLYFAWKYLIRKTLPKQDPDEIVIDRLKNAGTDVLKAHKIDYFLYFPTHEKAELAKNELLKIGISVEISKPEQGDDWLCLGNREMLPIHSQMSSISNQLSEIAQKYGGIYDGWGTGVEN